MKKITCFLCGNQYPAPLIKTSVSEETPTSEFFAVESSVAIACPRCNTQNDVTASLPDWPR